MSHRALRSALLYAVAASIGAPHTLWAQEASTLDDIIVTAQRRPEKLLDVPIALSVVSGDTLERGDIHTQVELFRQIPSLSITPFSNGQAYIGLRGAVSYDDGAGMDGPVAIYVDDVYMSRLSMSIFELFDLERVEVLRGPQGTLFGRNSIGGAINVVSALPTGETDAKMRVTLGNYDRLDVGGMVTGALADPLSFKVSFTSRDRDGWITNLLTGDKLRDENSQAARAHLRYQANGWDVVLSGDYATESLADTGRMPVRNGGAPIVDWWRELGGDWKHSTNPTSGFTERRSYGLTLRANRDLGASTLTSITAYRHHKADWEQDTYAVPQVPVIDEIHDKTNQISQEFRLAGALAQNLDYVAGLFYLREHTDRSETFRDLRGIDDRGAPAGDPVDLVDTTRQDNVTNSYAAFGQISWAFQPGWELVGGARLTHETKNILSISRAGGVGILATTFDAEADHSWTDFSPKLALERHFSENLTAYVAASKGFKSGGYGGAPGRIADAVKPVKPETAWNVEFGLKSSLLDQTLHFNAAVFRTWYKNLQNNRFGPPVEDTSSTMGVFQTVNIEHGVVQGIELEGTWRPVPPLTFSASYSFIDAEYHDSVFVDSAGTVVSLDGQRMPETPRHKVYVNATWLQPISYGKMRVSADYTYTSAVGQDVLDLEAEKPSYSLVNAQLAWTSPDERWEAMLWAKNLFNEKYFIHVAPSGLGILGSYGDPRMYGVSLTWRY